MALPPGITPKTVTVGIASFFDGTLAEGTATITAPVNVVHTPSNRPIFSSQIAKRFVDGEASFDLAPTDAPGLNRVDWTYKLNVVINGALVQPDPIYFVLPEAGPDTIDLDALVAVPSSAGTPVSVAVLTAEDLPDYMADVAADEASAFSVAQRAAFVSLNEAGELVIVVGGVETVVSAGGGGGLTVEQIQDVVASMILAGTNVTTVYDDGAGTITLSAATGGGSTDTEVVRDTIAAALVGGNGVSITANDNADTITIAITAAPASVTSNWYEAMGSAVDPSSLTAPISLVWQLAGNLTLTSLPAGRGSSSSTTMMFTLRQATTGGPFTVTWPPSIRWVGRGSAPAMPTKPGSELFVEAFWTGEEWRASVVDGASAATPASDQAKLRRWFAVLASRLVAPAQILALGDSITEGTGTSNVRYRWVNLLQTILCSRMGSRSGAAFPFIPAIPATTAAGMPVTSSGTVYSGVYGLGQRSASLIDDTGSVTFTFTGTSAAVMFTSGVVGGIAAISVDGAAATTQDTFSGSGVGGGAMFDTGPLTRGQHTVTVTRDPSSVADRVIFLEGLLTFDGDASEGIRVIDAGHHGANSGGAANNSPGSGQSLAAAGGAGLMILALTTNDVGLQTVAQAKTNLAKIVTDHRVAGFAGSVLYVAMPKAAGWTAAEHEPYVQNLRELANADPDGLFLDLADYMPNSTSPEPHADSLGLYADAVPHPTDAGNGFIADVIARVICP